MNSTLRRPNVHQLLDRLHCEAARDDERAVTLAFTTTAAEDSSALRRAEERESLYMPILRARGAAALRAHPSVRTGPGRRVRDVLRDLDAVPSRRGG